MSRPIGPIFGASRRTRQLVARDCFSIDNIDVIRIYNLRFGDDQRGIEFSLLMLIRSGTTCRGHGEFVGARETSWNDYSRWTIELVSSAIPTTAKCTDFSDFVPGAPSASYANQLIYATVEGAGVLHVDAVGSDPLGYQWYFSLATRARRDQFSAVGPCDYQHAGSYFVTVSNACGMVDSYNAAVRVWPRSLDAIEFESISYSVGWKDQPRL